jgi:hypothetical protein
VTGTWLSYEHSQGLFTRGSQGGWRLIGELELARALASWRNILMLVFWEFKLKAARTSNFALSFALEVCAWIFILTDFTRAAMIKVVIGKRIVLVLIS